MGLAHLDGFLVKVKLLLLSFFFGCAAMVVRGNGDGCHMLTNLCV